MATATATAVAAKETVLKYSATLDKFSTDSVTIVSEFQMASTEKMLAFDASITGRIETVLDPLLTTTLATMLDAKLSAHLTRFDESLSAAIVNYRSQSRPDVPGTEKDVLGKNEVAEDVILGAVNTMSNADRSPEGLAATVFDDTAMNPSQHGNAEAPFFQHQTDSPTLNSGDARFQGTPGRGGRGYDNSALGRGCRWGT